jgi:acyl-CoA thioesterase-1
MSFCEFRAYSSGVYPVVLQIANGNAFFIGMGLTVVTFGLRLWLGGRVWVSLLTVGRLVGICLVLLSATPMSWWLYGLWLVLCIGAQITIAVRASFTSRTLAVLTLAFLSLSLCVAEWSYCRPPSIAVFTNQPVYVVGDSLSAGIGDRERVWPIVLGDLSRLKVINLAHPGATIETALDQAAQIDTRDGVVIVEIGGNDLLGHTDRRTFYRQLDGLLRRLKQGNRRIIMFELPLFPFWNAFGEAQRALAKKHGVTLIPKRYLAGILGTRGATVDGLHLSQHGHNKLAGTVLEILRVERPVEAPENGQGN